MITDEPRRHSLSMMLRRSAQRHAQKTALTCGEVQWSYDDLDRIVDRLTCGLKKAGYGTDDRIAVLARNSHAFIAVRFAVARIGAVFVPINFMLLPEEVRYILEHCAARALFVDETTAATAKAAAPAALHALYGMPSETQPVPSDPFIVNWATLLAAGSTRCEEVAEERDVAQIIYTSGTESRPKGAMLTHAAVLWQYQSCIIDCEWSRETIALHAMPLFHCAQLDAMLGPALSVGATNIITAEPSAQNLIPLLARHRVTSFFAPPTIWISLLRSPLLDVRDLSSLIQGYYGASIMPVEILRELQRRLPGLRLWNLYGQTEIAPVATILFPEEHMHRLGSAGRPTLHVQTRVVDEAMVDVAVGQIGEIVHRSPQLFSGYWHDQERTAEAFAGGWFHSGDLGVVDADGYITVVDRKKDMIKTGGENVSSREVEEIIYGHPAVSEAAVIGVPDPKWIEVVTAVVVKRPGAHCSEAAIIEHCSKHLARFKTPKRVVFVATLPRNASGKILKRELRQSIRSNGAPAMS